MANTKAKRPRTGGNKIKPGLPAPGMEEFHTRAKANEGQRLPLYTADGRLTSHWLQVRGVDSDVFRKAYNRQQRRAVEIAAMPEAERDAAIEEGTLEMRATLVAGWSFAMECTLENIINFLREAPQIAAEVDKFASRRAFFFKMQSQALNPTPPPSSP